MLSMMVDERTAKHVSESGGRKGCICALQTARASLKEIPANMATNAKEYQLE